MAGGRRLQAPFGTAGFAAAVWIICAQVVSAQAPHPTDVSGLAWIAADSFLVVHDAKVPEELDWPRLSIVRLPDSAGGPIWHALEPAWPPNADPSHDLESIARIPGSNTFILLESGDDGTAYRRMFIGELENQASYSAVQGDTRAALALLESGAVRAEPLVTHRFALEDTGAALAAARSREGIKVVVTAG